MTYLEQTSVYAFPVAKLIQRIGCPLSVGEEVAHPVCLPCLTPSI
jgi:hypothetical protein